jgi:hypothetical protein
MKRPTPLARQCGNGKRRRKKPQPRKETTPVEQRLPDWIIKQAERERAKATTRK